MLSTNCVHHLAVFSFEIVSFWKLSFTKLILSETLSKNKYGEIEAEQWGPYIVIANCVWDNYRWAALYVPVIYGHFAYKWFHQRPVRK